MSSRVVLTSDRGWVPGAPHDWKPQERVLVMVETPGAAGVVVFSGAAPRDIEAAQGIHRAVAAALDTCRAERDEANARSDRADSVAREALEAYTRDAAGIEDARAAQKFAEAERDEERARADAAEAEMRGWIEAQQGACTQTERERADEAIKRAERAESNARAEVEARRTIGDALQALRAAAGWDMAQAVASLSAAEHSRDEAEHALQDAQDEVRAAGRSRDEAFAALASILDVHDREYESANAWSDAVSAALDAALASPPSTLAAEWRQRWILAGVIESAVSIEQAATEDIHSPDRAAAMRWCAGLLRTYANSDAWADKKGPLLVRALAKGGE